MGSKAKKVTLQEFTLKGYAKRKNLVVQVGGFIAETPAKGFPADRPDILEEPASQFRKAERAGGITAIFIHINSPGGLATEAPP